MRLLWTRTFWIGIKWTLFVKGRAHNRAHVFNLNCPDVSYYVLAFIAHCLRCSSGQRWSGIHISRDISITAKSMIYMLALFSFFLYYATADVEGVTVSVKVTNVQRLHRISQTNQLLVLSSWWSASVSPARGGGLKGSWFVCDYRVQISTRFLQVRSQIASLPCQAPETGAKL